MFNAPEIPPHGLSLGIHVVLIVRLLISIVLDMLAILLDAVQQGTTQLTLSYSIGIGLNKAEFSKSAVCTYVFSNPVHTLPYAYSLL